MSVAEALVEERADDAEARFALAEVHRAFEARRELLGSTAVYETSRTKRLRLPAPNPTRGSIALTLRVRARRRASNLAKLGSSARRIFFVKLDGGQEGFDATELIPSNYSHRQQVYLLNAEPGRYVAVTADLATTETEVHFSYLKPNANVSPGTGWSAFLSMAMISATEVTVGPQEMAFMGEYLVTTSTRMKKGDAAQAHYYRLLQPEGARRRHAFLQMAGMPLAGMPLAGMYLADLESAARDPATEREFWTKARDRVFYQDPRWQARVARRLATLAESESDASVSDQP